ncbi:phosphate ABC transporter ATP-binding protein [Brevibacillus composti]|uniref:Phosphate ABC transporter ATP-binding protein n=1 Tax=Brevibacillus composti TaxID=2796470 RepID=A0A7T5JMR1_9BACL|nr:phosphate ABC transporter ATP-binding protein [Brevibacillus composti]QQE73367.1 phosphate ABC transporter ATP-binding protein [Brevibacillus composti]QQE73459.1 phosphate ABC transporter ATP-binding protein [Brevibacillus composti]QUO40448.1 phosphate ABC transporter ATP-binding protein [Brevibacillus composti]QUO40541.1 phosphate ABC transporter ATP-binding protein [Brevibacillus composti]
MAYLELEHLQVAFAGKTVLHVEKASFNRGKIYGIVGPSGSGKSTLLRVLSLLERPAAGWLNVFGENIHLPSLTHAGGLSLQRRIGYVQQKPTMFDATVFDNVALGLRYRGMAREEIQTRVGEALRLVELEHTATQRAHTLSGGEAQRIALARVLVYQPDLLFLDEPTANLDPYHIAIFERVIQAIHQERQTTVLIVTHNLQQARRLTDHCLFIHKGSIVERGETEAFFAQPQTSELDDFLCGRMIY